MLLMLCACHVKGVSEAVEARDQPSRCKAQFQRHTEAAAKSGPCLFKFQKAYDIACSFCASHILIISAILIIDVILTQDISESSLLVSQACSATLK